MVVRRDRGTGGRVTARPAERDRQARAAWRPEAGCLLHVLGSMHRVVALLDDRVLLVDARSHHVFLIQEDDGTMRLPTTSLVTGMVRSGEAAPADHRNPDPSASQRMRMQIAMLDAAEVAQGEKSIFIHLATHWTRDLEARFGPFDDAAKIRRWRTALRRAERRPKNAPQADAAR